MSLLTLGYLLGVSFLTAVLTGVFGLAGGLVLMGALALVLPVSAAFVTHGLIQIVANGARTILHRHHVRWSVAGTYAVGALIAGVMVSLVSYSPSKPLLFLLLGLVTGLVWLPDRILKLDAARPLQGLLCGLSVTGLNLAAGVAGPMLDIFFVRTEMTRHQVVATKSATQVFSHLAKVIVFGGPMLKLGTAGGVTGMPPLWFFLAAIPLSIGGTVVGGWILNRISDANFRKWTRWLVSAIGVFYLIQAARLTWLG